MDNQRSGSLAEYTPKALRSVGNQWEEGRTQRVHSLSVADGWWLEGHLEGSTGWDIGHSEGVPEDPTSEAASLYDKLESTIVPMFYGAPRVYAQVMRTTIAVNASFFNTQRMLSQYLRNAYQSIEIDVSAAAAERGAA